MDEMNRDEDERALADWRRSLAADAHFLANVDMLEARAKQGALPASSGSLKDRIARLRQRRKP